MLPRASSKLIPTVADSAQWDAGLCRPIRLPAQSRSGFAPAFAKPASAGEGRSAKAGWSIERSSCDIGEQRLDACSTRGARMRRLFLAALVAGATVAPASAEIYDNTTIPIYVATPDSFTIRRGVREGYDFALSIDPVGDFPGRVAGEPRLCGLYFKAVPSGETQQWLNSRWKDEALLAQVRRSFERIMQMKSETTFALRDVKGGDVVGLELVGSMRREPTAVLMTSLVNTPRGQLQMACLLRAEKAFPTLRSIRDTIRPPR